MRSHVSGGEVHRAFQGKILAFFGENRGLQWTENLRRSIFSLKEK
jgi:hypothetical protein